MSGVAGAVFDLLEQAVLVAGIAETNDQHDEVVVQRFLADGTLDSSYGTNGLATVSANGPVVQLDPTMVGGFIQADGSVIAIGEAGIFRLWQ